MSPVILHIVKLNWAQVYISEKIVSLWLQNQKL